MPRHIVTTCTRDCPNTCGLIAYVEGGRVAALKGDPRHPVSRGFACPKCADFLRRAQSPERILTPLRREGETWRPIGWEEALGEIARRMSAIKAEHGPEAILYYRGFAQRTALKLLGERFFNLFGGVTGLRGTLCGGTGQAAQELDFGVRVSHDPLDHTNSLALILWGRNPVVTSPSLAAVARRIRKKGGRVVLIDPAASESRSLCDLFIQPAPGSDAFLALAAAKTILSRGTEDGVFLTRHSEGFPAFRRILDRFSLAELSRHCDVAVDQIQELAEALTEKGPAAISLGWGLHRRELAHQAIRAIDALGAIAGVIGIPGGGISQGFDEYAPFDSSWNGDHLHPRRRRLLMPLIGEEILSARDPAIEMIFATAGNPVCMAPNAAKVRRAFERTPFVVVAGHFLDDTGRTAHIFLPTTTFLEEEDFAGSYGHNLVGPVNPAAPPPGECRSDFDIFRDLATRLGLGGGFNLGRREWFSRLLAPVLSGGLSLETLQGGAVRLPEAPMVPFADRRFPTPSGKFRFMEDLDIPPERPEDRPYPLQLLSVAPAGWLCSEQTPADQKEPTEVRLHPETAFPLGIGEGELVLVESEIGSVVARVRLCSEERRDTLIFPRGKWFVSGSSVNLLTRDLASRVGEGTPYYETRVRIVPKAGLSEE